MKRQGVWIGMAEVRPMEGNSRLGKAPGAFVNVVAWARSDEHFKQRVLEALEYYEYAVVGLADVRPFETLTGDDVDYKLKELAEDARKNKAHVRVCRFHTYYDYG